MDHSEEVCRLGMLLVGVRTWEKMSRCLRDYTEEKQAFVSA